MQLQAHPAPAGARTCVKQGWRLAQCRHCPARFAAFSQLCCSHAEACRSRPVQGKRRKLHRLRRTRHTSWRKVHVVSSAAASSGVAGGERSSTAARVLHLLNDSTKWAVSLAAGGVLLWRRDAETMWCLLGAVAASFLCRACTAFVASLSSVHASQKLHCVHSVCLWLCLLSPYTVTPPAARPVQSLSSPGKGVPTEFQRGLKLTLKHQRPAHARKADPGMPSSHANSLAFLATSAALALLRPSGAQAGQSALLAALPLLPAAFLVRPPRRADAYHASSMF